MRNPGKLQSIVSQSRLRRRARVNVPSRESRDWEREVAAMERVLRGIAEDLQRTAQSLDGNLRRMDAIFADIAEEKRQAAVLRRELGIGR